MGVPMNMQFNMWRNKKIVLILIFVFFLLTGLTVAKLMTSYYSTYKAAQVAIANEKISIVKDIALGLDVAAYRRFLSNGYKKDEDFDTIHHYLLDYRVKTRAMNIYTLAFDGTSVSKVLISVTPPGFDEPPFGYPCTVPPKQVHDVQQGNTFYTNVIPDDYYGNYLTVGAPIFDENKRIIGAVGMDISSEALDQIGIQVVRKNRVYLIMDLFIDIFIIAAIYYARAWYRRQSQKDVLETEKLYLKEFGQLIHSVKMNRHDFGNHLHVVRGLLDVHEYDKAREYLNALTGETKMLDLSLKVNHSALLVLLNSKWERAQLLNIEMNFDLDASDFQQVKSTDIVKIMSNLIDNAIEANEHLPQDERFIQIVCKEAGKHYIFAVENTALLTEQEAAQLFQPGFTTKSSRGRAGNRGQGLGIVKQVAEKYEGEWFHEYADGKLIIQIIIKAG